MFVVLKNSTPSYSLYFCRGFAVNATYYSWQQMPYGAKFITVKNDTIVSVWTSQHIDY